MAATRSATQSTPTSVPLVPAEPTITGMPAAAARVIIRRRSAVMASAGILGMAAPR
jgi:hypothetical protein